MYAVLFGSVRFYKRNLKSDPIRMVVTKANPNTSYKFQFFVFLIGLNVNITRYII